MEDQLITFETAKLAKEKGFDWITDIMYSDNELKSTKVGMNRNPNFYSNVFSAPTQSLLQKWLREVYKIHLYIIPGIEDEGDIVSYENPYGYIYILLSHLVDPYDNEDDEDDDLFKTYEEALEHGLQEALKLIKL